MPKLCWTQTGDAIELEVLNRDVYDYFIEKLNSQSLNRYTVTNFEYASLSQELQHCFGRIQKFIRDRLCLTDFDFDLDTSDQDDLNHLHRQWVKLHQRYPNISKLTDPTLPRDIAHINELIHAIEKCTEDMDATTTNPNYTMPNHFGTSILGFDFCNVSIPYNNLGRSTWEKWQNDDRVDDSDTNNFNEIYTNLKLNVSQVKKISAPYEYQIWCDQHKMPCVGRHIPLANLDKLNDNLLQYRQLFYKNSLIENNFITLE